MKMKKRIGYILTKALLLAGTLSLLGGCFDGCFIGNLPGANAKVDGYWKYTVEEDGVSIIGVSPSGYEQEILIVPKTIQGNPVKRLVRRVGFAVDTGPYSENLKKVFVPFNIEHTYTQGSFFRNCKNLKKIIALSYDGQTQQNMRYVFFGGNGYMRRGIWELGVRDARPANVSFKYNYENSPLLGYHWIDDLDYGSKIGVIPSSPVREGYTFTGWYKDEDCTEKWDFTKDTTSQEIKNENGNIAYQETILYAGWQAKLDGVF